MQVPQNLAVENECQYLHVEIGLFNRRRIMKHEDDASDGKDDKKKTGHPAEAKREGKPKSVAFHLHRKNVKEEVVVD